MPKEFIPQNAARQCAACKNHIPFTLTCKAFPNGIPQEILSGHWDHRETYKGDGGILYEPEDPNAPVPPPHPKNKRQQEEDNMALENRNGRLVEVDANGEPVKGHKEPWEKFLTKDEFWRLPDVGRKMAEYWTEWMPRRCKQIAKEQSLAAYFQEEGQTYQDMMDRMIQRGLAQDGAWEVIKEMIFLPPEK